MSFYGIETGLTGYFNVADGQAQEDRQIIASRVARKMAELRAIGLEVDDDEPSETHPAS